MQIHYYERVRWLLFITLRQLLSDRILQQLLSDRETSTDTRLL
jgi:hypothetical protein